MLNRLALAALSTSLLAGACANRADDATADSAVTAIDSTESAEAEGNLMLASIDGSELVTFTAATPEQIATRIAANAAARWNPSGCATVARAAAQVTITYRDCTGPRGLIHVTGAMVLTVTAATTGAITVHGTSTDMQVNRAVIDVDATATYAVAGTAHSLTVSTAGTGTGPRGNPIEHHGDYTVTWDTATQCHTVDGSWQTDLGVRERANDVSLRRCAGGCPTGTVTHHFLGGAALTVTFDGTATARWTSSRGGSGTTPLGCQ